LVGARRHCGVERDYSLAWSMDTAGPMTRTVEDCALMLGAIAGHDPKDPTTARQPVADYLTDAPWSAPPPAA
jgi:Asp-tRNA(Asn)/Glu-tRNA(Gln) amidotransferase A subunit family amidase